MRFAKKGSQNTTLHGAKRLLWSFKLFSCSSKAMYDVTYDRWVALTNSKLLGVFFSSFFNRFDWWFYKCSFYFAVTIKIAVITLCNILSNWGLVLLTIIRSPGALLATPLLTILNEILAIRTSQRKLQTGQIEDFKNNLGSNTRLEIGLIHTQWYDADDRVVIYSVVVNVNLFIGNFNLICNIVGRLLHKNVLVS